MVLIFYGDLIPPCIAMPTADRIRFNLFTAAFMNYASHGEKRHVMVPRGPSMAKNATSWTHSIY